MEDRAPQLRAVAIFDLVIGVLSMIMRIYSRLFLARIWKLEDWIMAAAFCTFCANMTTCLLGLHYGTGKHFVDLTPYNIKEAMMWWWMCYPTYIVTMILAKCSVGVFFNRITANRVHHWILYISMFVTTLVGVAFFFIAIFQCSPVDYWWKQVDPTAHGHCINIKSISNVTYVYSAVGIVTDFVFAFLPLHIVMGLQMDKKTKLVLVPIFGLATLASIACVVRLSYLPKFTATDFLYTSSDIVIWSETEVALAVAAGNLATCRPLFKQIVQRFNTLTGRTTRNYTQTSIDAARGPLPSIPGLSNIRRKLFPTRSFSKDIEVQTYVNVRREKGTTSEAYTDVRSPSATHQKKSSGGWFESRAEESDEEFIPKNQNLRFNAV